MVDGSLTRRQFLELAGLAAGALAMRPLPPDSGTSTYALGRVAATWIGLYREPSFSSARLTTLQRDELVNLLAREVSDDGPAHNPLWYRVADGYVHSGYVQVVRWQPQPPQTQIPQGGGLFEVSVPFTRSYREADPASDPIYRLYYQATAWVDESTDGADGRRWYRLLDDVLRIHYYVRAEHLRRIPAQELTPISPDIPFEDKRIEVSLARQELMAFERDQLVLRTLIASGLPDETPRDNGVPTITPTGSFHVNVKTPLRHMGDGHITSDLEAYELPGVPWVSFFVETGVGFHGTYWHNDFGTPKSHGCINMRTEEAKWLYRWSQPHAGVGEMLRKGLGTVVIVT